MSFSGHLSGDIYSHCWFYESTRRSFQFEGYGNVCGGITAVALTAFMVESYLNLSCKLIFDLQARVNEVLDSSPSDFFDAIDDKSVKGIHINDKVAIAYGFKEQLDNLIGVFNDNLFGRKKVDFSRLCVGKSFYEIDDKIRFSPKAKFFALSEVLYADDTKKKEHRKLIEHLFNLRNSLAHGRSEFVSSSVWIEADDNSSFSSESIPPLKASWQEQCSIVNAKKVFDDSCEIIKFLSLSAFNDKYPFRMPTQIGAFLKG
ncbi:hypothetical protein ACQKC7_02735 [Pseudoalteromonas tetraodonis]|uniref:hypothetical protein n=1 Tax=Pseudoalteromonas tetraodonis TaxID=43659 RepID=UPI003D001650